ncbi:hypothetical protein VitviT2T_007018 [Vitis vinifera]|uniref:Ubiquitin-like domain-containing protein n=2 Tax=Vitis vinifera TaxID=29760 RepID=A0ABY9BXX8_VITVI|nr:hypothetical protein VitviT2T_007018 [Vitis vinifera]
MTTQSPDRSSPPPKLLSALCSLLSALSHTAKFAGKHHTTALKMPQPAKRPLDQSTIEVKVKSQDGRQLYFRINRSTPLQRLLVAYCQQINIDYKTMQFVYNGNRVTAKQTPEQLGMEDGDEIDALTHQMGGGCRAF